MPTFDGVTGRVYFKAWRIPRPRRAAVVYLRGSCGRTGQYYRLGNALCTAGIELWALDQAAGQAGAPPVPATPATAATIEDLAENGRRLTALAQAARPGGPVFLAGHSLGALAAAVAALRDPRRYAGLILSGAPLPSPGDELLAGFAWLTTPVLFAHGTDDPVAPIAEARAWAARLPFGRMAEFAGARHDVLNESCYQAAATAIASFVLGSATRPGDPVAAVINRS